MTEQQRNLEKQRALDRAIDYKDRSIGATKRKGSKMNDRKDVEVDIEQELIDATSELVAARAKLRDICRRYAEGKGGSVTPAKPDAGTGHTPKARTGGLRATLDGKKQFAKKIKCVDCGTVTGSRLIGEESFPLNHKDPRTGTRCKGIFKKGELVTEAK